MSMKYTEEMKSWNDKKKWSNEGEGHAVFGIQTSSVSSARIAWWEMSSSDEEEDAPVIGAKGSSG